LEKNTWRGNVRELRHFVQREFYLTDDEYIKSVNSINIKEDGERVIPSGNLKDVEKIYIQEALKAEKGNVLKAAERLNIGKSTVYRKIKKYDINTELYK
jgi:transcriptional regulator with PAS, ATPase and Fis domain